MKIIKDITLESGLIEGSTTWGHDTGVVELNIRDFNLNWTGTGTISGSGDSEKISLEVGQYMESEIVAISGTLELLKDHY